MKAFRSGVAGLFLAAGLLSGGAANAEIMEMTIPLTGAEEVPPVETSGSGEIAVTYDTDTRILTWELDYSGLTGDPTAAHFHGPADPGENAPPVIPLTDFSDGAEGSAELTEAHVEALQAGKLYFNLHTEANPDGEIRGQVTAQ